MFAVKYAERDAIRREHFLDSVRRHRACADATRTTIWRCRWTTSCGRWSAAGGRGWSTPASGPTMRRAAVAGCCGRRRRVSALIGIDADDDRRRDPDPPALRPRRWVRSVPRTHGFTCRTARWRSPPVGTCARRRSSTGSRLGTSPTSCSPCTRIASCSTTATPSSPPGSACTTGRSHRRPPGGACVDVVGLARAGVGCHALLREPRVAAAVPDRVRRRRDARRVRSRRRARRWPATGTSPATIPRCSAAIRRSPTRPCGIACRLA